MKHEENCLGQKETSNSLISYTQRDHETWSMLYNKQKDILKTYACDEYLSGLELLKLSQKRIPQLIEINAILEILTGFSLVPVKSLLPDQEFFAHLAKRQFPVATFIRSQANLNYIDEPDVFHELVGHCPMLTNILFANFLAAFGKHVIRSEKSLIPLLAKLFFFTIETGLIATDHGLRIYGSGILSSYTETQYAMRSVIPCRKAFDISAIFRMNYDLKTVQKTYFVIDNFKTLFSCLDVDFNAYLWSNGFINAGP